MSECIKPTGLMSVPGTNITKQDWTFRLNIFLLSQIPGYRNTQESIYKAIQTFSPIPLTSPVFGDHPVNPQ